MTSGACTLTRLALVLGALANTACGDDGDQSDGSGTETTTDPTTTPSTSSPTTSPSTTVDPSTSTDPTDTDDASSTGAPDESSSTGAPGCGTPGEWSAPSWAKNTAPEATLRTALASLVGDTLMRGAETGAVTIDDVAALTGPFEAGAPSLASITHAGYRPIVDDAFEEFVEVVTAGEQDLVDGGGAWTPGEAGGIWGDDDRGIDEGGLEVRQIVDKGLFSGGAFYHHALLLTEGEIDEAVIDRIAYIWGNNEALDPESEETPLDDAASYGYQQGFHAEMAAALTAAKTAAANAECEAERDAALQEFFALWEQSMMSRFVHYMSETALILTTATTDTELASALHELTEGIGLAAGFYGLPAPASGPLAASPRVITDEELDLMLGAVGVNLGDLGMSTTGAFVESLPAFETAQSEVEGVLMDVYGVDAATIAAWRTPTPG